MLYSKFSARTNATYVCNNIHESMAQIPYV